MNTDRSWNRGGPASGRGRGHGRNEQPQRAVTFDMSQNQTMGPPNPYSPTQQNPPETQEVFIVDNEQDSSSDVWG